MTLAGLMAARIALGAAAPSSSPLLVIGSVVTLVCGYPILRSGVRALTGRNPFGTDAMVTLATATSLLLGHSVTALAVVCLLDLGEWLHELVQARTQQAMRAMLSDLPTNAWVVRQGAEILVHADEVRVGEIVAVRAGDRTPVDGIVVEGDGLVDDATLARASGPAERRVGDEVLAGARLLRGSLRVRAERTGTDSVMGQLRLRVSATQTDGAPIGRVGQQFARRLVPVSIGLAVLTLLLTRDPSRAIAMLLIACPCAMGLSARTAMTAALHVGARSGILFKRSDNIGAAARVDTVILDTSAPWAGAARSSNPDAVDAARALRRLGLHVEVVGTPDAMVICGDGDAAISGHDASLDTLRTIVAEARAAGRRVAVVSDRLDDLPLSPAADLRIAIGDNPTVAALACVDVFIARSDLGQLVMMFDLSRRTLGVVRQNYGLSFLAEGAGLLAGFLGMTHPVAAAMVHSLSTLCVLGNSARVIGYERPVRLSLPEPSVKHPIR